MLINDFLVVYGVNFKGLTMGGVFVKVRVSEEERERLKAIAKAANSTVSNLLRAPLTGGSIKVQQVATADPDLLLALNKIGNNLNQLARHANTRKQLDIEILRELGAITTAVEGVLSAG